MTIPYFTFRRLFPRLRPSFEPCRSPFRQCLRLLFWDRSLPYQAFLLRCPSPRAGPPHFILGAVFHKNSFGATRREGNEQLIFQTFRAFRLENELVCNVAPETLLVGKGRANLFDAPNGAAFVELTFFANKGR